MASYAQWARSRPVRRLTWVCGPEPVLVQEVVAAAVQSADECIALTGGSDPDEEFWDLASSLPPDSESVRLILVRGAERIRGWDPFAGIAAAHRELGHVRLLFLADEDDFPYVRGDSERQLAPHVAVIRDSRQGLLVRCGAPSGEALLEWGSQRLGGAGRNLAADLMTAAGGDLRAAADIAGKLLLGGYEPTADRLRVLAEPAPDKQFADALMLGDKPGALLALDVLSDGPGPVIALLESRLETLAALHDAWTRKLDAREIAVKLGIGQFLQRTFKDAAPEWTPERVTEHRSVLAIADDAWRSGAGEGILELVCALW